MKDITEIHKEEMERAARKPWPEGEWNDEPDYAQFMTGAGLPGLIVRNHGGALCGYVGVDSKHPYFEKDYDNCYVDVHGGLTYAAHCSGKICHKVEEGEDDNVWWLGFDCSHLGDIAPLYDLPDGHYIGDFNSYKNFAYVKSEVESLAQQLKDIKHDTAPRP